jgi:LPS-assembly lipoprotein
MRGPIAIFLFLAIGLLPACGFHLQGSNTWPEDWRGYALEYPLRDPDMAPFVVALDEALRRRGLGPVGSDGGDGRFVLVLRDLEDRKSVAAIGGNGKAVEFELRRKVSFQIQTPAWRSETYSVSANRRLSFDPTVVLAKEAEEERLRQGLSRDLIEQLLLRTEAELRMDTVSK